MPVLDDHDRRLQIGGERDDRGDRLLEGSSQCLFFQINRQRIAAGDRQQMQKMRQIFFQRRRYLLDVFDRLLQRLRVAVVFV